MAWVTFLTPDTIEPAIGTCRRLLIPGDWRTVANVNKALSIMLNPNYWEQSGSVTVDQAVEAMQQMVIDYLASGGCMIGTIFAYATAAAPGGSLPCDGATYNRTDYPNLYAALDSAFIIDADTFKVPDLRGRTVIGTSATHGIGTSGGEETHQLTVTELASHSHTVANYVDTLVVAPGEDPVWSPFLGVVNTGNTGGDSPHNNMQPYQTLKYGIWTL